MRPAIPTNAVRRAPRALGLVLLGALALAPGADAAVLRYEGRALAERQVEPLFRAALGSPGDSVRLRRAADALLERLQSEGRLDARVTAEWLGARSETLAVAADDGPLYRLAAIPIASASAEDSAAFGRALELAPGDVASPSRVAQAIERAMRRVADDAHPYATLQITAWEADSGRVTLRLGATAGPRVTVGEVVLRGLVATDERFAKRAMGKLEGLPYRRAGAEAARDRLAQTGLFRSVAWEGLEGEADWSRARLVYRVEEPRYNRFEGAVGVQGDAGTVGLAALDLDNLAGTGRALGLGWQSRGRDRTEFRARYAEPLVFGAPIRLAGHLEQSLQDSTWTRTRWGGDVEFTLSAEERLSAGYEEERVVQERGPVEEAHLANTTFALVRTTLDEPLAPRRGTRTRLAATQAFKTERLRPSARRSARASAVEGSLEAHRPLGPASGVSLALSAAGRFSSERVLPVFERYPVGGAASLRGYDEEAFRADRFGLSRLEWSRFLGGEGARAFLFWDHAWMATRLELPDGGDRAEVLHRDGYGFGLRLPAAGGAIELDYGLEAGRTPLDGKIHLRLVSAF